MKKVLSLLFALAAMAVAMFVVATLLHIDVKAEIERRISGEAGEETPPELPEV